MRMMSIRFGRTSGAGTGGFVRRRIPPCTSAWTRWDRVGLAAPSNLCLLPGSGGRAWWAPSGWATLCGRWTARGFSRRSGGMAITAASSLTGRRQRFFDPEEIDGLHTELRARGHKDASTMISHNTSATRTAHQKANEPVGWAHSTLLAATGFAPDCWVISVGELTNCCALSDQFTAHYALLPRLEFAPTPPHPLIDHFRPGHWTLSRLQVQSDNESAFTSFVDLCGYSSHQEPYGTGVGVTDIRHVEPLGYPS